MVSTERLNVMNTKMAIWPGDPKEGNHNFVAWTLSLTEDENCFKIYFRLQVEGGKYRSDFGRMLWHNQAAINKKSKFVGMDVQNM